MQKESISDFTDYAHIYGISVQHFMFHKNYQNFIQGDFWVLFYIISDLHFTIDINGDIILW